MARHLFILNPAAGHSDKSEALRKMIYELELSEPFDVFVTDAIGAAEKEVCRYLCEHSEDFTRIYACGGDGTLCEVANGVYRSGVKGCAIGVVPVGSGNDFVKSLNVPIETLRDLRAVTESESVPVDLLLATDEDGNERASLNIVSAGYDAAVAKGQHKYKKLPLVSGGMAYKISLVRCLFAGLKNYFTIYADGKPFEDSKKGPFLFAIAANGKYYGGGFKASPYSDMRDGLLELIRIDTVSLPRFLTLVGKFKKGKYIEKYRDIVSYTQCKEMQIVADGLIDLNLDGEIYPMRNPSVKLIPNAINMILPSEQDKTGC